MSKLLDRALCSIWFDIAHCGVWAFISVVAIGHAPSLGLEGKIEAAAILMWTIWGICALRERIMQTYQ